MTKERKGNLVSCIVLIRKIFFLNLIILICLSQNLLAKAEVTVFDVRKTLPMKENEKTYKDYYLNGGSEIGLKSGMILVIKRRMALYDSFQNKSLEELMVSIGKLKIIHVQKGLSVARVYSLISRKNTPNLDYNYIMLGDKADMKSVYMDRGKVKKVSIKKNKSFFVKNNESFQSAQVEKKNLSSSAPVNAPN